MVSVDHSASDLDLAQVGRVHRAIEPLHSHMYFAPEHDEGFSAIGLRPGRMSYFAGRAAPMGAVGAGVVTATFHNFSPSLVAHMIPRAWSMAGPEQVVEARWGIARASLTRLLGGPEAVAAPEVAELAGLLREACSVLTPEGRPLYAGHADLPWPDEPLLQLWHAATLLREHRGDGHIAVLVRAGLSGLDALITHTATGRGFTEPAAKATRGWSDEQWEAAKAALIQRGLLDDDGLTAEGAALRAGIEAETDELDAAPWQHLGPERTARVLELGKGFARTLVANGAFGTGIFGR
jgi:hypothetical protein